MTSSPPSRSRPRVSIFDFSAADQPPEEGRYLSRVLPNPPRHDPVHRVRRRKLWELPQGTLCPLMGVCLPISTLRRVLGRTLPGTLGNDYAVHCAAIEACTRRTPICEALQRELDSRHALALQRLAKAKSTEALAACWSDESTSSDPSGALWAALSHRHCDDPLRERICADIHMLQHQLGAGHRADLLKLEAAAAEHATLKRELAAAHDRHVRALAERDRRCDALAGELVRLRGEGIRKDSLIAALRDESAAAVAPVSAEELQRLRQCNAGLERELVQARRAVRAEGRRADELAAHLAQLSVEKAPDAGASSAQAAAPAVTDALHAAAVLCVGGRTASVPVYRRLIEVTGGRFAHHDGGEQQSVTQLEASLAAADLVICQTGCISHDAYWRVKDHCKRTGKRCVFVDNPSAASFARSLRALPERA